MHGADCGAGGHPCRDSSDGLALGPFTTGRHGPREDDQIFSARARREQTPLRCQNVYQQSWARRNCPWRSQSPQRNDGTVRRRMAWPGSAVPPRCPCRRTASGCQVWFRSADSERRPTQVAVRSWVSADAKSRFQSGRTCGSSAEGVDQPLRRVSDLPKVGRQRAGRKKDF